MTLHAVGIVAEYNPFHNGHADQIRRAKRTTGADVVVVAMSGNWVQRGEPALMDKWQRTQAALAGGVDLVVELPSAMAIQPANFFAAGGVTILNALGCDWLAFGTEHPDMDYDRLMANMPTNSATFKRYDQTYAQLFQGYLRDQTGITLEDPNDILGFFYAVANRQQGRRLQLVPLSRQESQHGDKTIPAASTFASATAIRSAALEHDWGGIAPVVPANTLTLLQAVQLTDWEDFWPALQYQLVSGHVADLRQHYQVTEGIEYRMQRAALESTSFAGFMQAVKTKRYTYTRLQRQATYLLGQIKSTEMVAKPQYLRVLGYSGRGQTYLHQIKKQVSLPLISRADREWLNGKGALDNRMGEIRTLITDVPQDYGRIPIKVADSDRLSRKLP